MKKKKEEINEIFEKIKNKLKSCNKRKIMNFFYLQFLHKLAKLIRRYE